MSAAALGLLASAVNAPVFAVLTMRYVLTRFGLLRLGYREG